uniref:Amine oxidase domain-containing protein n=1 Tax=Setaria digitata TaxID=48799 RepID=A0A915PUK1_9BILA
MWSSKNDFGFEFKCHDSREWIMSHVLIAAMSGLKIDKGFRLVIIGSGPTAIGMLHRIYSLITEGIISEEDIQVVILEKEKEVGGLARSITDEKGFTWDLGVHIIGVSKYQEFEEVVNSAVNKWNKVRHSVKADLSHLFKSDNPCSNYVPYPVQHSIPYFPPTIRQKCINELNELKDLRDLSIDCSNFAEYSANIFGNTLLDIFIRPYNRKVIAEDSNHGLHSYDYNAVLSTLPIPELSKISALIKDVDLKYSKVILVGLGLKYPQCEWTQFVTWVYFPSPDTIFYRCTFLSNFNHNLTPDCNQFWSVLCEIGLEANANFVEEEVIAQVIKGLKLKGIIAENNEIVDKWFRVLPYGYPIPTVGRDRELQRCHEAFQASPF